MYTFTNRFAKAGPVRGADKIFEKEVDPALLREPPDFVTLSREVLGRQKTYGTRFFRSISSQIIGVKMSCIARGILLPGQIMVFARDMKDCGNTDNR